MSLDLIEMWHQRARPNPTDENFNVQLGCHLEEIVEMFDTLGFKNFGWSPLRHSLKLLADALKCGSEEAIITDRKEFLDSLADQVVTAVGSGHCANMNMSEACRRVDASNWSKFDTQGYPMFNTHGKIIKGEAYAPPDLTGCY